MFKITLNNAQYSLYLGADNIVNLYMVKRVNSFMLHSPCLQLKSEYLLFRDSSSRDACRGLSRLRRIRFNVSKNWNGNQFLLTVIDFHITHKLLWLHLKRKLLGWLEVSLPEVAIRPLDIFFKVLLKWSRIFAKHFRLTLNSHINKLYFHSHKQTSQGHIQDTWATVWSPVYTSNFYLTNFICSNEFVTINLSQIYHLHEQNIFDIWNLSNEICSCKRGLSL